MTPAAPTARRLPLRVVEAAAASGEPAAIEELAARYTDGHAEHNTPRYRARVHAAYLAGWAGEADPFRHGRGGNFVIPLRRAHYHGHNDRIKLGAPTPLTVAIARRFELADARQRSNQP